MNEKITSAVEKLRISFIVYKKITNFAGEAWKNHNFVDKAWKNHKICNAVQKIENFVD